MQEQQQQRPTAAAELQLQPVQLQQQQQQQQQALQPCYTSSPVVFVSASLLPITQAPMDMLSGQLDGFIFMTRSSEIMPSCGPSGPVGLMPSQAGPAMFNSSSSSSSNCSSSSGIGVHVINETALLGRGNDTAACVDAGSVTSGSACFSVPSPQQQYNNHQQQYNQQQQQQYNQQEVINMSLPVAGNTLQPQQQLGPPSPSMISGPAAINVMLYPHRQQQQQQNYILPSMGSPPFNTIHQQQQQWQQQQQQAVLSTTSSPQITYVLSPAAMSTGAMALHNVCNLL